MHIIDFGSTNRIEKYSSKEGICPKSLIGRVKCYTLSVKFIEYSLENFVVTGFVVTGFIVTGFVIQ